MISTSVSSHLSLPTSLNILHTSECLYMYTIGNALF